MTCPKCIGGLVTCPGWAEGPWDVYCVNCSCRPLLWHKRFLHEPDGKQPWKGPESPYLLKRAMSA